MKSVRIRSFPVPIFPHWGWIQRDTPYFSVFSPNAKKYRPEKLWIQTLFTQCIAYIQQNISPFIGIKTIKFTLIITFQATTPNPCGTKICTWRKYRMRYLSSYGNCRSIEFSKSEVSFQTCFFICTNVSRKFICRFYVTSQTLSLKNSVQV